MELIYNSFTSQFKRLTNLARILFNHLHTNTLFGEGSFRFDMGLIVPHLYKGNELLRSTTSSRSYDTAGFEAVERGTLEKCVWYDVAHLMMGMEEDGVETDFIPEWTRAKLL
jgi:hypothetical protein